MTDRQSVVAVTGASGYVGGLAVRAFRRAGWRVVALARASSGEVAAADERRPFVLGERVDAEELRGVDVLLHCAYDLGLTREDDIWRVNVDGTSALFGAARDAGVARLLLISSMSAYAGTRQTYGRAKLASEVTVSSFGGRAVRLGLVYGEGWGGMAGTLGGALRTPLVPLIAGSSHQFTVHEDDMAAGLVALASGTQSQDGPIGLANGSPVGFQELLEGFARKQGLTPRFVPVPWRAVYAGARLAESVGISLPIRADSVLGLARPAPCVPLVDEWDALGVRLRPFSW